jgi:CheY-like chemotaxis protein
MVLAVVDDLLFGSKLRAATKAAGHRIVFVRDRDEILPAMREHHPALVVFDLDRDLLDPIGAIREIRSAADLTHARVVGFASHVHEQRLQEARDAGCEAMARSTFVAALPDLLRPDSSEQPRS